LEKSKPLLEEIKTQITAALAQDGQAVGLMALPQFAHLCLSGKDDVLFDRSDHFFHISISLPSKCQRDGFNVAGLNACYSR
jgi:hypothetical protein